MKGLIYKEFYLSRKIRIISLVVYLIMIILCILIKLSALYGNIGLLSDSVVSNVESLTFYLMVYGGAIVLYTSQFTNQIENDEKSRFRLYEHTLPLSEYQIVGSVYLTNLISLAAVTLLSFIDLFAACLIFDRKFEPKTMLYIFSIGCLTYVAVHGFMVALYVFRRSNTAKTIRVVFAMILYFGGFFGLSEWIDRYAAKMTGASIYDDDTEAITDQIMIMFFKDELLGKARWVGDNMWWLIPSVLLTITVLWFFLSVYGLKRRGN